MSSLTTDNNNLENNSKNDIAFASAFNYKRLLRDVKNIYKDPLTEHNIHYYHNDENCKEGYALIIGPKDTLYRLGFYFFKLCFPDDYPFSPPKVEFLTQGNNIRFNPNLYRNGKVCLSILNTWKGEQWTSCQSIKSVLLTIAMHCFTNTPLLNEPGVTLKHRDYKIYNDIIEYGNYTIAIKKCLLKKGFFGPDNKTKWNQFEPHIVRYIIDNKDTIINDFKEIIAEKNKNEEIKYTEDGKIEIAKKKWCGVYSMKINFDYQTALSGLINVLSKYK